MSVLLTPPFPHYVGPAEPLPQNLWLYVLVVVAALIALAWIIKRAR